MERPWTGPRLPRQFRNTPEARRQIEAYNRYVETTGQPAATNPLESVLPILVRSMPLAELKGALTPKYSGDIRYRPAEEAEATTFPPQIEQPERDLELSIAAGLEEDLIDLASEEEPEPLLPTNYRAHAGVTGYIQKKCGTIVNSEGGLIIHPLNHRMVHTLIRPNPDPT